MTIRAPALPVTGSIQSLLHIWDLHYLLGWYHQVLLSLHRHANLEGMVIYTATSTSQIVLENTVIPVSIKDSPRRTDKELYETNEAVK